LLAPESCMVFLQLGPFTVGHCENPLGVSVGRAELRQKKVEERVFRGAKTQPRSWYGLLYSEQIIGQEPWQMPAEGFVGSPEEA
jgi:hypothetical protein